MIFKKIFIFLNMGTLLEQIGAKEKLIRKNIPSLLMIFRSDKGFEPQKIRAILQIENKDVEINMVNEGYEHIYFEYVFSLNNEKVYVSYNGDDNVINIREKSESGYVVNVQTLAHKKVSEGWSGLVSKMYG